MQAQKTERKLGRPKLPSDLLKDHFLMVRLTSKELAQVKQGAKDAGLSMSDWVRKLAVVVSDQYSS